MSPRKFEDLNQCRIAIYDLKAQIAAHHGPAITHRLFAEAVNSKRELQQWKNHWLLARHIRSGLSVKRFAAKVAERNKSLSREHRHGPNGSGSAEAIEKQIRRQKKIVDQDPLLRGYIENLAKHLPADIS